MTHNYDRVPTKVASLEVDSHGSAHDRGRVPADALLESMTDAVFSFDAEWKYTYVNAAGEQLLGKLRHELIGRVCCEVFPQFKTHENARRATQAMVERRTVVWEARSLLTGLWMQWRAYPMADGGISLVSHDIDSRVGAATDIEEQRNALSAERASRAAAEHMRDHMQRVLAQAPLVLVVFRGPEHTIEIASGFAEAFFARPLIGLTARSAFPELKPSLALAALDQVYATGNSFEAIEFRSIVARAAQPEQERYFDVRCHALKDASDKVYGVIMFGLDVTARVHARHNLEQARRQAEHARAEAEHQREELARVLAQAPFAVSVVTGPKHVLRSANEMQQRFIGYRAAINVPLPEAFPDPGMDGVYAMLDHVYATGETMVVREQPIGWDRTGNGDVETGFFDVIYQPIRSASGAVEGVLTFTVEVSTSVHARRAVANAWAEAEQARIHAETARNHLHAILAAIPTPITVTKGQRLVYDLVNPAFEMLTGKRQLVGRSIMDVFPEVNVQFLLDVLRTGQPARVSEMHVRYDKEGNGELYEAYFNSFTAPLRAPDGTIEGVVTSSLEVTEQVRQRHRMEALQHDAEAARAELEQAHAQLETRIVERTAELARANTALTAEIHTRAQAEAARSELLRRLATAREDEQRRTARDLHDQVGQTLSALMVSVKAAHDGEPLPRAAAVRLSDTFRLAEELGREIHELARRLRPALLDDLGLHAALRELLQEWMRRYAVAVDFQATWLQRERLPSDVETVIYRVVQEAMTNIARHASARHVSVVVERHEGHAIAVVEDDGVGFDPASAGHGRLGLVGMRERVMLVAGVLDIESEPGCGTTLIARIPIDANAASVGSTSGLD